MGLKQKYELIQSELLGILQILEYEERVFETLVDLNEYWDVLDKGVHFQIGIAHKIFFNNFKFR